MVDAIEEVTQEIRISAPVEDVWESFVSDDARPDWLGSSATLPLRPGGRGAVTDDGTDREVLVHEVEPGHRLSFDWWTEDDDDIPSHVELVLQPTERGTLVRVTERPLIPQATTLGNGRAPSMWELRFAGAVRA